MATARWTSSPQCRTPCRGWDSTRTTSTKPTTGSSPRQVPSEALPARPDPRRGRCRRHLGGHRAPRLDRPHRHHGRGPRLVRRVHPRRPHLTTAQQKRPAGRIGGAPNPSIPGEHHMVLHHSVGITYGIELPADTDTEAIERACFGQPDSPDSVGYIVIGDRDRLILATRYTPAEENTVTRITADFATADELAAWDTALRAVTGRLGLADLPAPGWLLVHNYR